MKKQLKKSLSLFLAVLMLMSCWVWVAPQKAEAAEYDFYKVTIQFTVTNTCEGGGYVKVHYWPLEDGKFNTEKSVEKIVVNSLSKGEGYVETNTYTVSTDSYSGFPYKVEIRAQKSGGYISEVVLNSITIGDRVVTGEGFDQVTVKNGTKSWYIDKNGTQGGDWGKATADWPLPKFSVDSDSTENLDITTIPGEAVANFSFFDENYNVKWLPKVTQNTPTIKYDGVTKNGMTAAPDGTTGIKVSAASGADRYNPGNEDSSWVLTASFKSTDIKGETTLNPTVDVLLTHPNYTVTFDGNGGKFDASDAIPVKGVYGALVNSMPSIYDYKGYQLSVPSFNTMADGTGSALTESTVITGDQTYYAQWEYKDVDVTFLSADGQIVGTIKAKYNGTLKDYYNKSLYEINKELEAVADDRFSFNSNKELEWKINGVGYNFDGWRVYSANDLDGKPVSGVNGLMYDEVILPGDTVFQATYSPANMNKYTVKFFGVDGNEITASTKKDYLYGDFVVGLPEGITLQSDVVNNYEHIGWAKKIDKKYYTVDKNGYDADGAKIAFEDKNGAEIIVRGNADYVPVFRMLPIEYEVTYNYTKDNKVSADPITIGGIKWGEAPVDPEILNNYVYGGYRYFLQGWRIGDPQTGTVYQLKDIMIEGDTQLYAVYGNPILAEYTIEFLDIDGKVINADSTLYSHGASVTAPTVGDTVEGDSTVYDIPKTIVTDDSLYTFKEWSPAVIGIAVGDAKYKAIYEKKDYADIYYYNYDGTLIYKLDGKENGLFVDEKIPAYENLVQNEDGATTNALPERAKDEVGTYNFKGWQDSNGNIVVPGKDVFSGDTYLTAQFETVYKDYTITFLNDIKNEDGEQEIISQNTYHYGDKIVIPENPVKDDDVEFSYSFRSWSPDVSEFCHGDATYTATYIRSYQTYIVTWLKDNKDVHSTAVYRYNAKIQQPVFTEPVSYEVPEVGYQWVFKHWVLCDEFGRQLNADGNIITVPADLLSNPEYGYVTKIEEINSSSELTEPEKQAAIAQIELSAPAEYIAKNEVIFVRGDRMPGKNLYFYPVFEGKAQEFTVNFYNEDCTDIIKTVKIPFGGNIADYNGSFISKAYKPATDEHHYKLNEKWTHIATGAEVDIINETLLVNGVISLKPTYTEEEHQKVVYEIVAEPTCTVPGFANNKCMDDECNKIDYNVAIPIVEDNDAPIGKLYVGNNLWDSSDFGKIDYNEITYVSANTFLIVNANDVGTRTRPNPLAELSRGVGKMEYFISTEEIKDLTTVISGWTEIYNYEEAKADVFAAVLDEYDLDFVEYSALMRNDKVLKAEIDRAVDEILAHYNANATGIVSNLNLEDGKEYIIYIRLSDREGFGEVNVSYLSSGTISYGTKAPSITVTGDGYGSEFCRTATINITDDIEGTRAYIDGVEITLVDGEYEYNKAGTHTLTAIDVHGNKTSKVFEIKGRHSYRQYTIAATCEVAGSKYEICTLCGDRTAEITISAKGHSYTENYIDKAPDCVNNGYRTYVCDNNCGLTLVLYPTSSADDLAQAKKFVEPAEGEEEGTWVDITAADLAHLVATGKHTYAMVKGEDGKDTDKYEWVIDQQATCKTVGSKHRDCTVCGLETARVTEEIPVDTENGHNFYRVKIISEPLCQEIGKKGKTCRYCGYVETTEYIPALGHVAGKYVTIVEPTCVDKGSEMLTCAVCESWIGEGEYDPMKAPVAKEIPALGHAYEIDGEVYSEEETDEETGETITVYYQNYKCSRCNDIKNKKLDGYVPPVKAAVSFVDGEEATELNTQEITKFVGESIAADAVTVPTKEADATYTYTFSHWADKDGNAVKFPIEVKGDAIYYAVYAERYINYTITYYAEDDKGDLIEIGKTGYLKNGETYDLAKGPAKAASTHYSYEFVGWIFTNDAEEAEAFNTYTINGSDIKLKAKYTKADRYYAVTYAYDTENILETFLVKAGSLARPCFETPTKAYDNVYHYSFEKWDKAEQLNSVTSNIYTTPIFTETKHTFGERVVTEATCTENKVVEYICKDSNCGYSYTAEVENTALGGHNWKRNETTGLFECQNAGCNETVADTGIETYTITYYNAIGRVYTHSYKVYEDTLLSTILPTAPEKAADKMYTYTFIGWSTVAPPTEGEDTRTALDAENTAVKSDLKLYPLYEGSLRKYTVVYAYNAGAYIDEEVVEAGAPAKKEFENITKDSDTKYHYTFKEWNKAEELKAVYSDIYTTPNFTHTAHDFEVTVKTAATCTTDRVDTYTCECGYSYPRTIPGTALGHEWGEAVNGVKKCTRCDATSSESVTYSIVYYNAKGNVYTRAYNIKPGTLLGDILPLNGPAKAADKEKTYEFIGWALKSNESIVPVFVNSDLELVPVYAEKVRTYTVKFLNATGDVIYETTVEVGEAATCPIDKLPTKAPDGTFHYTFKGWSKQVELDAVYSDVVTSADFTAVEHTMDNGVVTTAATCQQPEIKTYTCTAKCGYSREAVGSTGDHVWGEPETANGVTTIKCTVEGCNESKTTTAVYTVKYYADKDATEAIATKIVEHGKNVADISVTTPTKAKDDAYTYEFSHWALKTDADEKNVAETAVTADIELVAIYTSTDRLYTVIFGYDAKNILERYDNVKFANINAALYNKETPVKEPENNQHYIFDKFEYAKYDSANNAYIYYAEFKGEPHTYNSKTLNEATCTTAKGVRYWCDCNADGKFNEKVDNVFVDYYYDIEAGKPAPHSYEINKDESKPAENGQDGKIISYCSVCGAKKEEIIKWNDTDDDDSGNTEQSKNATIKVSVTDGRNAVQNAKVDIYSGGNYITTKYTNAQGVTTFEVAKGKYNIVITVTNADKVEITKDVQADCEIVGSVSIRGCGCACHRDNIWGSIFRFFHKIIKMLTGEFKCCSDPSHLYG